MVPDQPGCRCRCRLSPAAETHSCASRKEFSPPLLAWAAKQESSALGCGLWSARYGAPSYPRSKKGLASFIFRVTWSTVRTYPCHRDLIFTVGRVNVHVHFFVSWDSVQMRPEEREHHKNCLQQCSHGTPVTSLQVISLASSASALLGEGNLCEQLLKWLLLSEPLSLVLCDAT